MSIKNKIAYPFSSSGVDVALRERPRFYPCSTEGGRVYWADKKYNVPSYVIANALDTLQGLSPYHRNQYFYHSESDTYVQLISVNGHGEIRWSVHPTSCNRGHEMDAARYFGLIDEIELDDVIGMEK